MQKIRILFAVILLCASVVAACAGDYTWTGGGTGETRLWDDDANWGGSKPLNDGSNLTFSGSTGLNTSNNFTNYTFGSITLNPGVGSSFRLAGNAITLNSGITNSAGSNMVCFASITFGGYQTFSNYATAGGVLTLSTDLVMGENSLLVMGSGDINMDGVMSGSGDLTKGASAGDTGTLKMIATNSYTGSTSLYAGTMVLISGGALTGTSSVQIDSGAYLKLDNDSSSTSNRINNDASLTVSGGTFELIGDGEGVTETVASMTFSRVSTVKVTSGAVLNVSGNATFGTGAVVDFAALSLGGGNKIKFGNGTSLNKGNLIPNATVNTADFAYYDAANGITTATYKNDFASAGSDDCVKYSGSEAASIAEDKTVGGLVLNGAAVNITEGKTLTLNRGALMSNSGDAPPSISSGALVFTPTDGYVFANQDMTISSNITAGNLYKYGTANLTLTGSNNYSGTMTIDAGTLTGHTNSIKGNITDNAFVVFDQTDAGTFAGVIDGRGLGELTKKGAGALTLTGSNLCVVKIGIEEGTVALGAANMTLTQPVFDISSGATLDVTNSNEIRAFEGGGGATISIASGKTLTAGSNNGAFAGQVTGDGSFVFKGGSMTTTLSGNNTYTGSTTIQTGTLTLSGASGALSATSDITLSGGRLYLDNNSGDNNNNRISNSATMSLRGGTLSLEGKTDTATTESFGALSLDGGESTVTITKNGDGGSATLTANSFSARSAGGGAMRVVGGSDLGGSEKLVLTGFGVTDTLLPYVTVGSEGTDFGQYTSGSIAIMTSPCDTLPGSAAADRVKVTVNDAAHRQIADNTAVSSLILGDGVDVTQSGPCSLTVQSGGLIFAGSSTVTVNELAFGAEALIYNSGAVTIASPISGDAGITKFRDGELTLSAANTYTGATTVQGGTLTLSGAGRIPDASALTVGAGAAMNFNGIHDTIGSLAGSGSVLLGAATLTAGDASGTVFSGVMSGEGGFTKAGAGTMTLSGTNTYTGTTTVIAGKLLLNAQQCIASPTISIASGATLQNAVSNAIGNTTAAVTANVGGTFDLNGTSDTVGSLAGAGGVKLGAGTLTVGGDTEATFSGAIEGSGGITRSGNGKLTLSGANTYTGTTTVSGGSLIVGGASAFPSAKDLAVSGGTFDMGSYEISAGTVTLTGGTITGGAGSKLTAATAFNVQSGDIGNMMDPTMGTLGGSAAMSKTGTGTVNIYSNNSTYTGTFNVSAGTLAVNDGANLGSGTVTVGNGAVLSVSGLSSAGTAGNVTVLSGGTLLGSGTLGEVGTVDLTGTIAAGAVGEMMPSVATIHSGSQTWHTGGTYAWYYSYMELPPPIPPSENWGTLAITGDLNVADAATFTIAVNGSKLTSSASYGIATFTGSFTGSLDGFSVVDNTGSLGSFSLGVDAHSLNLTFTAVPEPSVAGLFVFALPFLAGIGRFLRKK